MPSCRPRLALATTLLAVTIVVGGTLPSACSSSSPSRSGLGAGAPTSDKFGVLASPCGTGRATGTTDQGVTDRSITIGFGDDHGYSTAPGLNHQQSDAVRALIRWCNEQGGIEGRRIRGVYYDAKVAAVREVMTRACSRVFMLVGEGFALDAGQEDIRLGCNLAAVPAWAVSPAFANGKDAIEPVPAPVDYLPVQVAASIAKAFPDKIKKSAVMYANYTGTTDSKDRVLATYPAFGFEFLNCPQQYNLNGEPDWSPFVQKLKDCGAEIVYFAGSPYPAFESVLEAADKLDYHPIYLTDSNFYDDQLSTWNKDHLGDNTYVHEAFYPLEEADRVPAVKQYLEVVRADGGDVNLLGEQATSAFLLWATAAKECGSRLTRACVIGKLKNIRSWTAGGLHAPTDPASNLPPKCGVVMKLDGTRWVRFDPSTPGKLDCSDSYVVKVTGPVVDKAKLDANRISHAVMP